MFIEQDKQLEQILNEIECFIIKIKSKNRKKIEYYLVRKGFNIFIFACKGYTIHRY